MDRSDIRVGTRLMFTDKGGSTVYGTVERVNRKTVTLKDTTDGATGWRVSPFMLAPASSADPGAGKTTASRSFRKGDRVTFKNGSRIIRGTVMRVNRKTVSVEPDGETESRYWRVSPSVLAPAKDLDGGAAPPADTSARDKAKFARCAPMYDIPADAFGKLFWSNGTEFRICGIETRRPKFPVLGIRVSDGKRFKFTAAGVRRGLIAA